MMYDGRPLEDYMDELIGHVYSHKKRMTILW